MRVRVHRGTREVGGSCVELEAGGARVVLDVGRPLWADMDDEVPLPPIEGLSEGGDPSLLGVLISHAHPDHYGLTEAVGEAVPLYAGEATARILEEAAFFTPGGLDREWAGYLRDREPLELGPFTVTPFLVDHSAFDAYALLVEAGGRRLFYSGDLRAHGRKDGVFERLLADPPSDVDVLLLEGTRVGVGGEDQRSTASEEDVERACVELFRKTEGMVLAAYSPQNVDRLVSLFKAALRSDRDFVMDLYAASVAAATGLSSIPQSEWKRVRVFLPKSQKRRVFWSKEFDRVNRVRPSRIFEEELRERPGELVLSFRPSMAAELERMGCLDGASVLWSMWAGYLKPPFSEEPRMQAFTEFLDRNRIPMAIHHASGHATVPDLQRFAEALAPTRIVPIHTAAPARYEELFAGVEIHCDGEWWEV